jgi:tetratricopeptide (TPR) repeat protein
MDYAKQLEDIRAAYDAGVDENVETIVAIAMDSWSSVSAPREVAPASLQMLGEVFRRAAIACVATGRPEASTWRSRSLTFFTLGRSSNGIAMIVLTFALAAFKEGDYTAALAQLELMELLRDEGDEVLKADLVESASLENKAIVLIAQKDWESAKAALTRVVEIETNNGDFRRRSKANASLTTVAYHTADRRLAREDLVRIIHECESHGGAGSVIAVGKENLERMSRGEQDLLPYQVI